MTRLDLVTVGVSGMTLMWSLSLRRLPRAGQRFKVLVLELIKPGSLFLLHVLILAFESLEFRPLRL
jgi:hypothetical protein